MAIPILNPGPVETQDLSQVESHIGGVPRLRPDTPAPACSICEKPLTFFFQLWFPETHAWSGRSLALFAGTQCAHEDFLIPEMLPGDLAGVDVPKDFVDRYQQHFRTFVVSKHDASPRTDLKSWITYRRLRPANASQPRKVAWLVANPSWLIRDESPATIAGRATAFLCQIPKNFRFDTEPGAPPQMQWGFFDSEPSPERHYELFLGNQICVWGDARGQIDRVYVLTQR